MGIVTKKGDEGKTSTLDKSNIAKYSSPVETYGYLDELNSTIGLVASKFGQDDLFYTLVDIQQNLMLIGSHLADPKKRMVKSKHLKSLKDETVKMENEIETIEAKLPKLDSFIVPVGLEQACLLHVARTKVRALERKVVKLGNTQNVDKNAMQYLNRLSDYLFTLARQTNHLNGIKDVKWKIGA